MKVILTKRYYITAFALLFIISFGSVASAAEKTYHVGASNLQVRSTPDSNGKVLGKLGPDHKIVGFAEKHGWVQTYFNGQEAWVAKQFLTEANTPSVASTQTSTVRKQLHMQGTNVRLRSGPSTEYKVVGTLGNREDLRLLETSNGWHKVTTSTGQTGWVASWFTNSPVATQSSSPAPTETNKQVSSPVSVNGSLNGVTVVLDAGHGGNDPGAFGIQNAQEKHLTMQTTQTIAQKLRNAGANVQLTRTGDEYLSLPERVNKSTHFNTNVFISVHYNAYPIQAVNGFSTHFFTNGEDRQLASVMQSELESQLPLHSRGIMQDDYYVLRKNPNLSVLLELGFITNFGDYATIQTEDYQSKVANGVTNALLKHFQ